MCLKFSNTAMIDVFRLASVQDHRPSQVPNMAPLASEEVTEQKNILLENIRSLVPDHEQRLQQIEVCRSVVGTSFMCEILNNRALVPNHVTC